MRYKYLGKTGERVSCIGLGTWKIGSLEPDKREKERESLLLGIELGVNLIDTAESYGSGESEKLVGSVIKEKREELFIATKVWPSHLRYDDVIKACNKSLERLSTSYIDLYQIHWPNPRIPIRETMSAMEKLVEEGKIRYIGVSNFSLEQLKEAQEALSKSEIVSNQIEYSLVSRSAELDMIPYAEKEKISIIAYSPLARGNIPKNLIPKEILTKYNATEAQIMLAWIISRPSAIAIPKAANKGHVREDVMASEITLSDEDYMLLSSLTKVV